MSLRQVEIRRELEKEFWAEKTQTQARLAELEQRLAAQREETRQAEQKIEQMQRSADSLAATTKLGMSEMQAELDRMERLVEKHRRKEGRRRPTRAPDAPGGTTGDASAGASGDSSGESSGGQGAPRLAPGERDTSWAERTSAEMEEEWKETQQGSGVSWTAFVGLMKCQATVRGKLERRRLAEKRARKARFKSIGDAVVLGSMMMASTRQKREELEELKARCVWPRGPEARDHGPGLLLIMFWLVVTGWRRRKRRKRRRPPSRWSFPLHLGCRTKGGVLPSWPWRRLFLGPGFRLGARWNRLVETVKTRKK